MDKFLSTKKALIKPLCAGSLLNTFVYSVALGMFTEPKTKHRGTITKKLKQHITQTFGANTYRDFDLNIESFEENFDVSIIVFGYNPNTNRIFCKKPMCNIFNNVVSILQLPDDSYVLVSDLSRLLSAQVSFSEHRRYICEYCLKNFPLKGKKVKNHLCVVGSKIPECLTDFKMVYKFKIKVREGKPGFADDDEYTSCEYKSFKDVYNGLANFNIEKHWPYLRRVQDILIKQDGGVWVDSYRNCNRYSIWVDDLPSLGVTELEFDVIIADIDERNDKK